MGILIDVLLRAVTVPGPRPREERVLARSSGAVDVSMQYRKYSDRLDGDLAAPLSIITPSNMCWGADMLFRTLDLRVALRFGGDWL